MPTALSLSLPRPLPLLPGLIAVALTLVAQVSWASDPVVAVVGDTKISQSELDDAAAGQLLDLRQKMHEVYAVTLENMIAERLLTEEASKRGLSLSELEQVEVSEKVPAITEAELNAWYAEHSHEVGGQPLDAIRFQLMGYLQEERQDQRRLAFLEELKGKTPVDNRLEPFRLEVAGANRPRRGPANAPVEIIEFSDFECPYCTRGAATIDQVVEHYGDKVSVVFRHYPLPFHQNAPLAAQAASCANEQGKFFAYHDLLFANGKALGPDDLVRYAQQLNLKEAPFKACLESRRHEKTVEEDLAAGTALGVSGTPAFFINGRPLLGAQPLDAFMKVIDQELASD